jgi:hypothetical protein
MAKGIRRATAARMGGGYVTTTAIIIIIVLAEDEVWIVGPVTATATSTGHHSVQVSHQLPPLLPAPLQNRER